MNTLRGRGLSGQVVHEMGVRIMSGALPPGSTIDPDHVEREFEVSRTVVREALKVLTAKGLVAARPRFGTYVTERVEWQLLDADVMGWRTGDTVDARLVTELDEVRLIIEPAAAAMAATHRSDAQLERMRLAWIQLDGSFRSDLPDRPDETEADVEFHRAVLAASGNELLERFEVVLEPALRARDRIAHRHTTAFDFLDAHHAVYEAIAARDAPEAEARMRKLMEEAASTIAVALSETAE